MSSVFNCKLCKFDGPLYSHALIQEKSFFDSFKLLNSDLILKDRIRIIQKGNLFSLQLMNVREKKLFFFKFLEVLIFVKNATSNKSLELLYFFLRG